MDPDDTHLAYNRGSMMSAAAASPLEQALARFIGAADDPLPRFVGLVDAVRPEKRDDAAAAEANFRTLVAFLATHAPWREAVREQLLRLFATRRLVTFFADCGILPNSGFFSELRRRIAHRLLPESLDATAMRDCIRILFHDRRDHLWLVGISPVLSQAFWTTLAIGDAPDRTAVAKSLYQMVEAVQVLSHRVSAMGLEPELLRVYPKLEEHESPFMALAAETHGFLEAYRASLADPAVAPQDEKQVMVLIDQCRDVLRRVRNIAMTEGTSLNLTYLMHRLWQSLARMQTLLSVLAARFEAEPDAVALAGWTEFFREAVRGENQRNSVRLHFSRLAGLLALRVTDNASRTGEHYITTDRAGFFQMWRSAMGAGFIVGFMALLKVYAAKLELAPLNQAFVYSMDYALGFVLIYLLHFTVATKQPAMTAQTIAATISETTGRKGDIGRLADLIVDVLRTQLAAILGNVLVALPTAMLLGLALSWTMGHPFISTEKAQHLLHDLSPTASLALPHAAIAGVCLFLSGLISGYFDNLASYDRIPQRITQLRWLNRLLGPVRAQRFAAFIDANLGALAGNFFFGIMLGSMGTLGALLGLPLDIRHVAFSSANFAFAMVALDFQLPWQTVAWSALGVALIGVTNLAVSFALALWVALRARGVEFGRTRELVAMLWQRFATAPGRFLFPPRTVAPGATLPHS